MGLGTIVIIINAKALYWLFSTIKTTIKNENKKQVHIKRNK